MERAEAERWLGISSKLLAARDFLGSKTFAMRARDADPNNALSDQILAVVDTILAGEKRVNSNQQPDWYAILQLPRLIRDADLIADHYRRLVMCLNPERNRFPFADYALQLVMDAWSVLSDPSKKWLFDNELALYLQQQGGGAAAGGGGVDVVQQPLQLNNNTAAVGGGGGSGGGFSIDSGIVVSSSGGTGGGGSGGGGGGHQLNTFQLFQVQSEPQQQPQQQMWQSQSQHPPPQPQPQPQPPQPSQPQQQQQQQQFNFMHLQSQPQSQQQQQQQQIPQQWNVRDPAPFKGGGGGSGGGVDGERNKGILNGIGGVNRGVPATTTASPITPTIRPVPRGMPQGSPTSTPVSSMARVSATTRVGPGGVDGNAPGTTSINNNSRINNDIIDNSNNNNNNYDGNLYGVGGDTNNGDNDDNSDEDVAEEVDCFWTACPYCFYMYEYQKIYQGCTLRCQNCRRGFHAEQVPNPPSIKGGDGKDEKGKDKGFSLCCWGFYPLGYSMPVWKKAKLN